jgi:hypothetical protein
LQTTDAQVRKLMEEFTKHGKVGLASMRAGMDRKTGRKYLEIGKAPSELKQPRTWRTHEDAFSEDWHLVEPLLLSAPELEAKLLFEWLSEAKRPDKYEQGQLRSFQRKVKRWRATSGPPKEVFFAQEHRPGEAIQTDFTWGTRLGVTIAGEEFPHLLCHPVLPYSNWEWVTVCRSESMAALRRGVQEAVFRLGRRPAWHQTDNTTAATHNVRDGKRRFNDDYLVLMKHLGIKPRTIGVGDCEQNGDVEAANGALKRRLKQHLLLRGSSDFASIADYEKWVQSVCAKANGLRRKRLLLELEAMTPLAVSRLPEWKEERVLVNGGSIIRVQYNTYSVPSRLIGERLKVRVFDDRLEVWYAQKLDLTIERLHGRGQRRIDYRHMIHWLVRKPGAFERYRYRDELFPSVVYRRAYDVLAEASTTTRRGDLQYLRVLELAARTMECEVEVALQLLLGEGVVPTYDRVRSLIEPETTEVPELAILEIDLSEWDVLLGEQLRQEVA